MMVGVRCMTWGPAWEAGGVGDLAAVAPNGHGVSEDSIHESQAFGA